MDNETLKAISVLLDKNQEINNEIVRLIKVTTIPPNQFERIEIF